MYCNINRGIEEKGGDWSTETNEEIWGDMSRIHQGRDKTESSLSHVSVNQWKLQLHWNIIYTQTAHMSITELLSVYAERAPQHILESRCFHYGTCSGDVAYVALLSTCSHLDLTALPVRWLGYEWRLPHFAIAKMLLANKKKMAKAGNDLWPKWFLDTIN